MRIWYINNYNMLPEHGALNRGYYLGKYLKKLGHEPVVFVGSHPHNTKLQLIEAPEKYRVYQKEPFPWVLIKTRNYEGSKKSRVLSMFEFYRNMKHAAKHFEKPDAIIGSSAHPLAALLAIKLGKKYGCKGIVEVRDLWPESIVTYGVLPRNNPAVKFLYKFEKYLYTHADELIFTMENAWQYFEEQGLDKVIPREKVHYVNNGVDLEEFKYNVTHYPLEDSDIRDDRYFKVVYVGSIRRVNNLGRLLDAAKLVKNTRIRILIWGDGDQLEDLKQRVKDENIENVIFKGITEKKFIPYITSHADLNIMHNGRSPVLKYGLSANKLFDYAAAGRPIFSDFDCGMNPANVYKAGVTYSGDAVEGIAKMIDEFGGMQQEDYQAYCDRALQLANHYSYENIIQKIIDIINK